MVQLRKTYTKTWKEKDGTVRTKEYEYKHYEHGKPDSHSPFWIAMPREDDIELYDWHRLPNDIYQNKGYPICKCGKVFVPIQEGDTECFSCTFTKK